ncbi:MAG: hypothetical protein JJU05_14375 [Verrucomicrobia bacterium]|nr:hypothetical protein [Verrucomicrobiota bacterium]MCH8528835.1 hypothetical protein [Kiritimatiellia bacterium]
MKLLTCLTLTALSFSGLARAEVLSITSGIDLDDPTQLSADAGFSAGDIDTFGVRLNYRITPELKVFGGLGNSDVGSESDLSFGGGVIYTLPDFNTAFRSGIKASFYRWSGSYGFGGLGSVDVDINEITVRYVLSGNLEAVENLKWFGEVGLHFLNSSVSYSSSIEPEARRGSDSWNDTELGLEAGLLYDFTEDFAGIVSFEIVDKSFLNLALRYRF